MQVKKIKPSEIEMLVEENYGAKVLLSNFDVYLKKDSKVFLFSKGLPKEMVKESIYGLHFCTIKRNNRVHLTIEGSQMVGPKAKKNIATVNEENAFRFMEGLPTVPKDITDCELNNFVLVRFGNFFLGSGIMQEGYIESLVPKERRLLKTLKK